MNEIGSQLVGLIFSKPSQKVIRTYSYVQEGRALDGICNERARV